MLYAHCSYSLEMEKGTVVHYNFRALERQLVNTFISGKPELHVEVGLLEIYINFLYVCKCSTSVQKDLMLIFQSHSVYKVTSCLEM